MVIKFCIPIVARTKKNSQNIYKNKKTGRYFISPSSAYKQFEKDCRFFLPEIPTINYPINLKCVFYMDTRRRVDLVNLQESICDVLVKYKILEDDDRDVVASMDGSLVLYDKSNPRIEIEISKLENYQSWK